MICGIGIRPNQQLAVDAGLTVNDGIVVTESCLTSNPNVVAAGDCARFPYRGNLIRLESVQNSIDQAISQCMCLQAGHPTEVQIAWNNPAS